MPILEKVKIDMSCCYKDVTLEVYCTDLFNPNELLISTDGAEIWLMGSDRIQQLIDTLVSFKEDYFYE